MIPPSHHETIHFAMWLVSRGVLDTFAEDPFILHFFARLVSELVR